MIEPDVNTAVSKALILHSRRYSGTVVRSLYGRNGGYTVMKIGKYEFDLLHKGYIMGILNVTPDSFPMAANISLLIWR